MINFSSAGVYLNVVDNLSRYVCLTSSGTKYKCVVNKLKKYRCVADKLINTGVWMIN